MLLFWFNTVLLKNVFCGTLLSKNALKEWMREGLKKEEREGGREWASKKEKVLFSNNLKIMHNMSLFSDS